MVSAEQVQQSIQKGVRDISDHFRPDGIDFAADAKGVRMVIRNARNQTVWEGVLPLDVVRGLRDELDAAIGAAGA